jgi:hypothetical protein
VRIEIIPVIIGALLALAGLLLAADAILPEGAFQPQERRRRQRSERNRPGEFAIALGMFAMAAALIGRDTWKYSTIAVIIGVVALAVGSFLNLGFLKEYLFHRGAARRGAPDRAVSKEKAPAVHALSRPPQTPKPPASATRSSEGSGSHRPENDKATSAPDVGKRNPTATDTKPTPAKPGAADRAPDQPKSPPKMRDNRKFPRGK